MTLIGAQRFIKRVQEREIKTPSVTEQVKAKGREKKGFIHHSRSQKTLDRGVKKKRKEKKMIKSVFTLVISPLSYKGINPCMMNSWYVYEVHTYVVAGSII